MSHCAGELCREEIERGVRVAALPATRLTSRGPRCTRCWKHDQESGYRQPADDPQSKPPVADPIPETTTSLEEQPMARSTRNVGVDHAALIADVKKGMHNADLMGKYKISTSALYYHLKKEGLPANTNGRRRVSAAAPRDTDRGGAAPGRRGAAAAGNPIPEVLARLIAQRDKLNAAIEALQGL